MTTLNFNEIRLEILNAGFITEDAIINANQNAISITGEFTRNGGIEIDSKKVGVFGEDVFFKGIEMDIELPEIVIGDDDDETEENFKKAIQEMYPSLTIWLRID